MLSSPTTSVDVAIIGGGIAGSSTLLELLATHRDTGGGETLRVVVVERSQDVFAGLPYGERSGSSSLIVTPLREFLDEPWLSGFEAWLEEHREEVLRADPRLGISASWVADHAAGIREGRWLDLFVPRRLFGHYLRTRVAQEIAATPGAEVDVLTGQARALRSREDGWTVEIVRPDAVGPTVLAAESVVLAIGSPPKRALAHELREDAVGRYVADTHATSIDALLVDLREHLGRAVGASASGDVLLVGANADALELLHAVHRAGMTRAWDRRVVVLAPRGTPDAWTVRPVRADEYRSVHLAAYTEGTADAALTAAGVHAAIEQDVREAIAHGFSEQDTVEELKRRTGEVLDRLPWTEQQAFVDRWGSRVYRFYRPTGGDYQRVASTLLAEGRITVQRATYLRARDGERGWTVTVDQDGRERELPGAFAAVVNCAGFEGLSTTNDPFLRAILDDGVVRATPSDTGISVDETFEAAPGIFVTGPLLGGNLNARMRFWHLESCHRIIAVAPVVARSVLRRRALVRG